MIFFFTDIAKKCWNFEQQKKVDATSTLFNFRVFFHVYCTKILVFNAIVKKIGILTQAKK